VQIGTLVDQADALARIVSEQEARIETAEREGFEAGFEKGQSEGYEAALEHIAVKLVALTKDAAASREQLRDQSVELALSIVRKIAEGIGTSETVAALATSAARQLAPHEPIVLRVHPDVEQEIRVRLVASSRPAKQFIDIIADSSLAESDCVLETEFGQIKAGLETQLNVLHQKLYGQV